MDINYQGLVQIINEGKIENAVCGIHSIDGGIIKATEASFINNTVTVKIDPVTPSTRRGNSATFSKTLFTINDEYFGNTLNFDAHIKLFDSKDVIVSGCTLLNEAAKKSYQNGYNSGIWCFNSPLTVKEQCLPGSPIQLPSGECRDFAPSVFSGFNVAVSASNSGAAPYITVFKTEFTDNLYGVKIDAVDYCSLKKNRFNLIRQVAYGIYANNTTGYKMERMSFRLLLPM